MGLTFETYKGCVTAGDTFFAGIKTCEVDVRDVVTRFIGAPDDITFRCWSFNDYNRTFSAAYSNVVTAHRTLTKMLEIAFLRFQFRYFALHVCPFIIFNHTFRNNSRASISSILRVP